MRFQLNSAHKFLQSERESWPSYPSAIPNSFSAATVFFRISSKSKPKSASSSVIQFLLPFFQNLSRKISVSIFPLKAIYLLFGSGLPTDISFTKSMMHSFSHSASVLLLSTIVLQSSFSINTISLANALSIPCARSPAVSSLTAMDTRVIEAV